eukprot:3846203-Pyramimonas_sp.AAC.1
MDLLKLLRRPHRRPAGVHAAVGPGAKKLFYRGRLPKDCLQECLGPRGPRLGGRPAAPADSGPHAHEA